MDQIGVRELRQYASRYLARVARGETLQITDRGRPVALLVPTAADPWEQLILGGRIVPPSEEGDIADAVPADFGLNASARLAAMREHER